jgi:hypothetical protein
MKKIITAAILTAFLGWVAVPNASADLLVSSYYTHSVLRYDETTGAFIGVFASGGGLSYPQGLAFGPDGNLYVSSGANAMVLRYNGTTGAFMDTFVTYNSGGLGMPRGLVFGPDGNLYVSDYATDGVKRYNGTTGAFMDTFTSGAGLCSGWGLAFGPDGNLYASSVFCNAVLRYNGTTGAFIDTFASVDYPHGLVFGPDANLYVIRGQVLRYNGTTGAFMDTFASGGGWGLAFGPDGNLYVSSSNTDQVLRYNGTTGAFMDVFASGGGLDEPTFLIFTPEPSDTVPPTITLTTPADGAAYTLYQSVAAEYLCADEDGGSGLASCDGTAPNGAPIDTAMVGAKTFIVTAQDNAGNVASVTNHYSVIYNFSGFFQPVDNLPTINVAKAGSAIPVKWSLGGYKGMDIFVAGYPASGSIPCDPTPDADVIEQTVTAGGSSLNYDAASGQYIYVWKTEKAWAGACRQLVIKLRDGTYHRANFRFTK